MKKQCTDCGRTILGRRDKKFCSDLCRNNYHNRLISETEDMVRLINSILRKNRRILLSLVHGNRTTIESEILEHYGFNFSFHTGCKVSQGGRLSYSCYEFEYLAADKNQYVIMKKQRGPVLRKKTDQLYRSTA